MITFIDIETRSADAMPPIESVKVPGNISKPETVLKYQQENQVEYWKRQALDSMSGSIICIGYAFEDGPVTTFCNTDERQVVFNFAAFIDELQGAYNEPITWAHWNGNSFDVPWLWRKAIKHGFSALRNALNKDNRHMHTDLMKVWAADFKDYVSLASCAKFLGIGHEGGAGNEIHDLWQAGDLAAIEVHCKRDIETTREIYRRIYK